MRQNDFFPVVPERCPFCSSILNKIGYQSWQCNEKHYQHNDVWDQYDDEQVTRQYYDYKRYRCTVVHKLHKKGWRAIDLYIFEYQGDYLNQLIFSCVDKAPTVDWVCQTIDRLIKTSCMQ